MQLTIQPIQDATLLTALNKPLQEWHVQHYPHIYKPFNEAGTTEYFANCLADDSYMHIGAFLGDVAIGFVQGQVIEKPENAFGYATKTIHVYQLVVDGQYRRTGAGRALMQAMQQHAADIGATKIDLTVRDRNAEAITFYKSAGFSVDLLRMYIDVA